MKATFFKSLGNRLNPFKNPVPSWRRTSESSRKQNWIHAFCSTCVFVFIALWGVTASGQSFLVPESTWCTNLPNERTACCPQGYLLRPGKWVCEPGHSLAPLINRTTMTYDGSKDNAFITVGSNTLEVLAVWVIDNLEGNDWPHGPAGNFYYDFFDESEYLPAPPDGADKRVIDGPRVLRGPDHTHGTTYEWGKDDLFLLYRNAGLFNWGNRNRVILRIWESDGMSEDGGGGRRNDVGGLERITRSETMRPEGVWVPFHKYTNDHPRRRTNQIALWIKLRTSPLMTPPEQHITIRNAYHGDISLWLDGRKIVLQPNQSTTQQVYDNNSKLQLYSCGWLVNDTSPVLAPGCRWIPYIVKQGQTWEVVEISPSPRIVVSLLH